MVWATILIVGAGTFVLRASFLAAAPRLVRLSPVAERILRQIPPAVFAALALPSLIRPSDELNLWQSRVLAGVIAGLVAWRTRNVGLTLLVGMAALLVIGQLT